MILEITQKNIDEIEGSFLSKEYVLKELVENPFAHFFILKEKEEVIGYLYYSDIYERAEINQFEILESHRNCGRGQLLLDYFLKSIHKDVTLEVKSDNSSAIHLYLKNGFVKKAIREGYYQGVDGILMERKKI